MTVLDLLEAGGHDLRRTSVSHLDEIVDIDYHVTALDRGIITGFDSFGQDGYFTPTWKSRSDLTKMKTMVRAHRAGIRGPARDVAGHGQEALPAPVRRHGL